MSDSRCTIQHVSSCPPSGGAAQAAIRIHEGLCAIEEDSQWLQAGYPKPDCKNAFEWKKRKLSLRKIFSGKKSKRKFKKCFSNTTTHTSWAGGFGTFEGFAKFPKPDVYNFHWVANFLDWRSALPELTKKAPIVWTLHDMNPIQGAWHYLPEAEELTEERMEWDKIVFDQKKEALSKVSRDSLCFVAPSKWLTNASGNSELTGRFETVHIPNGLDTELFYPIEKDLAKESLGIASFQIVIGFIAWDVEDPRKGMSILIEALQQLKSSENLILLTAGKHAKNISDVPQVDLGFVSGVDSLRQFYSACDVFICPSLQDNLPNTILESMSCGTPVIANNVGGIPDMVVNNETGILMNSKESGSLANAIDDLTRDKDRLHTFGIQARRKIVNSFSIERSAKAYKELYMRLIDSHRKNTNNRVE